ncbi:MAG: hypothetical protein ACRECJ_05290 [Limisphaerales bacterium]
MLDSSFLNPYALAVAEKSSRWKLYALFAFILLVSVFFLRDSYWQTALSEREFINLYVEAVKLQTRLADQPEKARAETRKVLKRTGVTKEQVNQFIEQVNKKPDRWAKIWEKINKELEKASPAGDTTLPKNR